MERINLYNKVIEYEVKHSEEDIRIFWSVAGEKPTKGLYGEVIVSDDQIDIPYEELVIADYRRVVIN